MWALFHDSLAGCRLSTEPHLSDSLAHGQDHRCWASRLAEKRGRL